MFYYARIVIDGIIIQKEKMDEKNEEEEEEQRLKKQRDSETYQLCIDFWKSTFGKEALKKSRDSWHLQTTQEGETKNIEL